MRFPLPLWRQLAPPVPAQGLLTLADVVAPSSIEIQRDYLRIDDDYCRVIAITGYPRMVQAGWLDRLIDLSEPMDLTFHITPQEAGPVVRRLSRRLSQFYASRVLDERQGKISSAQSKVALSDIELMRDQIQRGDEHLFLVSLYIRLTAPTLLDLDARVARIMTVLDNVQLDARPTTFEHDLGVRSVLPEGHDLLGRGLSLDTSSLTVSFPFLSSGMPLDPGVLYGNVPNGSIVVLDPFAPHMDNANHVIVAKSGAGKSYFCKLLALRQMTIGGVEVVIIDPEHEYYSLCQQCHGQFVSLSSSSGYHINPFDMSVTPAEQVDGKVGDPLAEKVTFLKGMLDLMLGERGMQGHIPLTTREGSLLDVALFECYRQVGIYTDPATHNRPAPLLRDLHRVLIDNICGKDRTGLAERLQRYVQGSLSGLFAGPTNVHLDNRLVVFGIRELESELRALGLYIIADFFENRIRQQRKKRLLFIDEAWMLMQHKEGGEFLDNWARRLRKYWAGAVVCTQNAEDFSATINGRNILSQSAIKLLLKQDAATIDAVTESFQITQGERQFLLGSAKGHGLLFARGSHTKIQIVASAIENAMATTDPAELARMEATLARQSQDDLVRRAAANGHQREIDVEVQP